MVDACVTLLIEQRQDICAWCAWGNRDGKSNHDGLIAVLRMTPARNGVWRVRLYALARFWVVGLGEVWEEQLEVVVELSEGANR